MEQNQVCLLNNQQVEEYWPELCKVFENTPWLTDLYEQSDIYELIQTGQFQIWTLSDGMVRATILTRICQFPKKKIFEIIGLKGNGLAPFLDQIEDTFEMLAQSCGCDEFRAVVRPGLERMLRHKRPRRVAVWISRDVNIRGIQ